MSVRRERLHPQFCAFLFFLLTNCLFAASLHAQTTPDTPTMLERAAHQKVKFSPDEIRRITASENPKKPDVSAFKQKLAYCNNAGYVERHGGIVYADAAFYCGQIASEAMKALDQQNAEAELTLQRACALPRDPEILPSMVMENYCAQLGDLYKSRGQLDLALVVYQKVPNCHANGYTPRLRHWFETACPLGAAAVLEAKGNISVAETMFQNICGTFSSAEGWPLPCDGHISVPRDASLAGNALGTDNGATSQQNRDARIAELQNEVQQGEQDAAMWDSKAQGMDTIESHII